MPGSVSYDISGCSNLIEIRNGRYRLRPHKIGTIRQCGVAFGPLDPTPGVSNWRSMYDDPAYDGKWELINIDRLTSTIYPAYDAARGPNANSAIQLAQHSPYMNLKLAFTIEFMVTLSANTVDFNAKYLINESIGGVVGLSRFQAALRINSLTLYSYDVAGASSNVTIPLNPVLTGGETLFIKLGWEYGAMKLGARVYKTDGWTQLGFNEAVGQRAMPSCEYNEYPALTLNSIRQGGGATAFSSACVNSAWQFLRLYADYDLSAEASMPASPPAIFENITADGPTALLDGEVTNSVWVPNEIGPYWESELAGNVGDEGWTLKYECANTITGVWSAEMTWADFFALPNLTGRYLKFMLLCRTDGYHAEYIGGIEGPVYNSFPTTPVFKSYTRNGTSGTAIATGTAGDTIRAYAVPLQGPNPGYVDQQLVGQAVAGAGDTTINLDFTGWTFVYEGQTLILPAEVYLISERNGLYSAPSTKVYPRFLAGSGTPTLTATMAADRTSAVVTVGGIAATDIALIAWNQTPSPGFAVRTGPGTVTVTTNPDEAFCPTVLPLSAAGEMLNIAGIVEATGSHPHSDPIHGPHSRGE